MTVQTCRQFHALERSSVKVMAGLVSRDSNHACLWLSTDRKGVLKGCFSGVWAERD